MLGHVLYSELKHRHDVFGTVRKDKWDKDIFVGYSAGDLNKFHELLGELNLDIVINCIGAIKQRNSGKDKAASIQINSLWPHQLADLCAFHKIKLVHISTDCVFSGQQGDYRETDFTDSRDTYGLSKLMGEVEYDHALTLRTSIIGHEINTNLSLIDWFLSQENHCRGFSKAIFSGFPTISIARILEDYVLERLMKGEISGLYHLSSDPISKYELLGKVARVYGKDITIEKDEAFVIDRSLNSDLFRKTFNFRPKPWDELIEEMHQSYELSKSIKV